MSTKKSAARSKKSFYEDIAKKLTQQSGKNSKSKKTIPLGESIVAIREEKKITGAELCRKAGDLDARTLTAVEKGRIETPSMSTLLSIAEGLDVSVSSLFSRAESQMDRFFLQGNQKGYCQVDFPKLGLRVFSYTPLIREFFCGKLILGARKKLTEGWLRQPQTLFFSVLVGSIEIKTEDKIVNLKPGDNLFFNGGIKHEIRNTWQRDSAFMLVTAPSFL